jgi:hypothetical protein
MVEDPDERMRVLEAHSKELRRGPGLTTYNGIGNVVGGTIEDPELGGYYLRSVWFLFGPIPLFMVGIFLVSHPLKKGDIDRATFYFHRKVTFEGVRAAYGEGAVSRIVWSSAWRAFKVVLGVIVFIAVIAVLMAIFNKQ